MRVRVPFRRSEKLGFVWSTAKQIPEGVTIKKIGGRLDEYPIFNAEDLEFYSRASTYYGISTGELLSQSVPKKIQEGAAITFPEEKVFSFDLVKLSEAQQQVVKQIQEHLGFERHLIHGDTGAGKTEVYLELAREVLKSGGQVLFLVPEISLTPQLEKRLQQRVGSEIQIFHSNLRESKRYEAFCKALSGQADIFLGARSSLFLPFKNLKLVVVDEEHDASYKQSERGSYQARDLAVMRAQMLNIPIVLGSATPSIESYWWAIEKKKPLYRLSSYYKKSKDPLEIIDLKLSWKTNEKSFISPELHEAIANALENKQQSICFLNRRGSAAQRICTHCGFVEECRFCSHKLTPHFDLKQLICHLCGYQAQMGSECVQCDNDKFFYGGIGTKEIAEQLGQRFPDAVIERVDRDQTTKRSFLPKTIQAFARGEIDILVGTQMISKGIDIENLSVVGVILADQGWGLPDFRAEERSFQLLHQILGRAGRRGQRSRYVVQTFLPEHPLFEDLQSDQPFEHFVKRELDLRKQAQLPPFQRQLLWTFSHRDQKKAQKTAEKWLVRVAKLIDHYGLQSFGPVEAPIFFLKNEYRFQVLQKTVESRNISAFIELALPEADRLREQVKVKLDRDPFHFI